MWWETAVDGVELKALLEGRTFEGGYVDLAVASPGSLLVRFAAGTNRVLLDAVITAGGLVLVQPTFDNTYSAAGTSIPIFNRNKASADTLDATAFYGPTVNVAGTDLTPQVIEGGTAPGTGGIRVGAEAADKYGILLEPGQDIAYLITNEAGTAISMGIQFFALELKK